MCIISRGGQNFYSHSPPCLQKGGGISKIALVCNECIKPTGVSAGTLVKVKTPLTKLLRVFFLW